MGVVIDRVEIIPGILKLGIEIWIVFERPMMCCLPLHETHNQ
jgi:hypothetical protein